jgi:hypothetical protein
VINDEPFTGKYAVASEGFTENNKWAIGNREIADFICKEI